jgi:hypothetical protein
MGGIGEEPTHKLQCFARTHASISHDGKRVYIRCRDDHCAEAAYAKDRGKIAVHVWNLAVLPPIMTTIFLPNPRARSGKIVRKT